MMVMVLPVPALGVKITVQVPAARVQVPAAGVNAPEPLGLWENVTLPVGTGGVLGGRTTLMSVTVTMQVVDWPTATDDGLQLTAVEVAPKMVTWTGRDSTLGLWSASPR